MCAPALNCTTHRLHDFVSLGNHSLTSYPNVNTSDAAATVYDSPRRWIRRVTPTQRVPQAQHVCVGHPTHKNIDGHARRQRDSCRLACARAGGDTRPYHHQPLRERHNPNKSDIPKTFGMTILPKQTRDARQSGGTDTYFRRGEFSFRAFPTNKYQKASHLHHQALEQRARHVLYCGEIAR